MRFGALSVTDSATLIFSGSAARGGYIIHNASAVTIYIGGTSSVTTSNGIPLAATEKILADGPAAYNGSLYGIVASGTADLRYLEWGENDIT